MLKMHRLHVLLAAGAMLVIGAASPGTAQTPSAADGPWSGWAQCVLIARGGAYADEQVHTWRITGGPPRVTGSTRHWPGVWTVQGQGSRGGDTWTVVVPETSAEIAIWEIPVSNNVRFGSQHSPIVAPGAVRVTGTNVGNFSLQEAAFPATEGAKTEQTIAGTRTREIPTGPGWRKPFEVLTRETCTWNFTKGTTASNPPTPSTSSPLSSAPTSVRTTESGRPQVTAPDGRVSNPPAMPTAVPTPPSRSPSDKPRTKPTFPVPQSPAPAPAPASAHLAVTGPGGSIPAGNVFQVRVEARTADGTLDTAFNGTVTLAAAAPGGSNFSFPVTAPASGGIATVNVFLKTAANGYTITASTAGFASGTSAAFNVTP